ncbi:hypothetical protein EWM64_g7647 [Hericium alpestre]|uniref:3'-5' exonuclease n=1 Tax=Hericium alpestre TaxID=135208 RepID=A0A4Y9ZP33_9AGAM|nr:hypothetical protein EWM64_g7647 [Hericium alpestre]
MDNPATTKRKRGRPKGSKNKPKEVSDSGDAVKRPVGRPKGSKNKPKGASGSPPAASPTPAIDAEQLLDASGSSAVSQAPNHTPESNQNGEECSNRAIMITEYPISRAPDKARDVQTNHPGRAPPEARDLAAVQPAQSESAPHGPRVPEREPLELRANPAGMCPNMCRPGPSHTQDSNRDGDECARAVVSVEHPVSRARDKARHSQPASAQYGPQVPEPERLLLQLELQHVVTADTMNGDAPAVSALRQSEPSRASASGVPSDPHAIASVQVHRHSGVATHTNIPPVVALRSAQAESTAATPITVGAEGRLLDESPAPFEGDVEPIDCIRSPSTDVRRGSSRSLTHIPEGTKIVDAETTTAPAEMSASNSGSERGGNGPGVTTEIVDEGGEAGTNATGWEGRLLIVPQPEADTPAPDADAGPSCADLPEDPAIAAVDRTLEALDDLFALTDEDADDDEFRREVPDDEEADATATGAVGSDSTSRATLPTWLPDAYSAMLERLKAEIASNRPHQPSCYNRGTFMEIPPNPVLTIKDTTFSPELFYQPHFFIWIPHFLVERIPCPACHAAKRVRDRQTCWLRPNGFPKSPRRVTDLEQNIYLIGQRYVCSNRPCGKSYQSWSPALLRVLPAHVAAQFTHHLSHRGGITDQVAQLLRSCSRGGIGPTPFKRMMDSFHHRRFDQLHKQYLDLVYKRRASIVTGFILHFKQFGQFNDRQTYAGHVPSDRYWKSWTIRLIDEQKAAMDQHRASLTARVIGVDHSFKGTAVFSALHTTVNEYGEICQMIFTPTKGHDQVMPALAMIPDSLVSHGHGDTEVAYTDNVRADKHELELIFSALLNGVVPVQDHAGLPILEPPVNYPIHILKTATQINLRLNSLMGDMSHAKPLTVGMDMEWPVDKSSGISGQVAVIQIAHSSGVFMIQTYPFLRSGRLELPSVLLTLLQSPLVAKAGVGILSDLQKLYRDCGLEGSKTEQFTGGIELAQLAKQRNLIKHARISLADLTALCIQRHLPKDLEIRVSTLWGNPDLPTSFIKYAASDAYASLRVYEFVHLTTQSPCTLDILSLSLLSMTSSAL